MPSVKPSVAGQSTRLILGPYRSGKTIRLIDALTNYCKSSTFSEGEALLIVPSHRYQKLVERRTAQLIRTLGFKGFAGLKIASFYQACNLVLKRCGVVPKLIPEAVRPSIVSRALNELRKEEKIEHLLPIMDYSGTHGAVIDLIDELERSGLSPADVLSRLETSIASDARYYELALVYERYWQELDRIGYLDNRRVAFKCREILASGNAPTPLFGMVGVDGFDRFNHLQLQVLSELSKNCGESIICFDYSNGNDDSSRREYMWKDESFEDLTATFGDAHQDWISGVPQSRENGTEIEAFKTIDRFFEMEEIAARVKRSLVTAQTDSEEILVVVPSLRNYKGAIEAAFDDAGVPFFLDESIRMMTLPIVQFAVNLLKCAEGEFARGCLVKILTSRFFNRSAFALSEEQIEALDRKSQAGNLVGTRSEWLRIAAGTSLTAEVTELLDCLTPPPGMVPLTSFVSWCEDVLSRALMLDDDLEYREPLQSWIEERSLMEMQNVFASLVQEDSILYGDKNGLKVDYAGFLKKLAHVLEKANFRAAPASRNSVRVCSVDLADNRLFDEVYIAGLVEGEFPRRLGGRGFVNADEVGRWASFNVDIHNPRMHPSFEYALFQSLIQRARKKVSLSYPMWDMSGEELLPSFFLAGEAIVEHIDDVAPFSMAENSPVSARNYLAYGFWNDCCNLDTTGGEPSISDLKLQISESVAMVRARTEGRIESPFNGSLIESVRSGALRVPMPTRFSASRLNDYGKCPFRYWVSHVLNVMPFEEPTVKLEVRELGETYHLALEKFYDRLIQQGLGLTRTPSEILAELFEKSVEEALAWLEKKRGAAKGEFWEYEKKEIVFRLKKFLDKEIERAAKSKIDYIPYRVEAAFGMDQEGSAPPLVVTDGVRRVEFRGKIDRIDLVGMPLEGANSFKGALARVIDYKAGSTSIPSREATEGRNLQLPIYALAVEKAVMPGARVESGAYLSFTSGGSIGSLDFNKGGEDDDNRRYVDIRQTEKYILDYVESISKGRFTVLPSNESVCEKCDHSRVCRVTELKKGGDNDGQSN